MTLEQTLWRWREEQARLEGIESYKILSKATLSAIVLERPTSKAELLTIKGIKERKYQKYGQALLALVAETLEAKEETQEIYTEGNSVLTVSQFLDGVNTELSGMAARIQGEVTSVDVRERVVYFTLKDALDGSTLSCLIFRYAYQVSNVMIAIGDEIIVEGVPEIYKPYGKLSLRVGVIEAAGEGALKKAYDELLNKLSQEGIFEQAKTKQLPEYPTRLALITSQDGAAIGDFTTNLLACGFRITLYPTAVEGKRAVFELLRAVKFFRQRSKEYDVLVVIRGGGSLESLQAFNNETLVREIASFPLPTLVGVGHEKDITLAALAGSQMVSTPTAAAQLLSLSWQEARHSFVRLQSALPRLYTTWLENAQGKVERGERALRDQLVFIQSFALRCEERFFGSLIRFESALDQEKKYLYEAKNRLSKRLLEVIKITAKILTQYQELLGHYDPQRALRLGYSLIYREGKLLKDTAGVKQGDILTIDLAEGRLETFVKKIMRKK